jgi:hypothetical protein
MSSALSSGWGGFSFTNGSSSETLNVSTYTANASSARGGLTIATNISGSAAHQYRWIQGIDTNKPLGGSTQQYVDPRPNDDALPFYETNAELASSRPEGTFNDAPSRAWDPQGVSWTGYLFFADYNSTTSAVTILGGIKYGFTLE